MCGIAGIISENPEASILNSMLAEQAHRGPDYTGTYFDKGFAALGHNRLSIIDLSSEANQPFTDENHRYFLTFNGEIYNYKELREELKSFYTFRTTSDTEVLLATFLKWNKNCLEKLNGMFAFAIWDSKEKKLFAARDRFGVKPFYYHKNADTFVFGSEIKTVLAFSKQNTPNKEVWSRYFQFGSYGMPSETFYKDIYQLPGGHFLEYSEGNLSIHNWYNFESRIKNDSETSSFEEAKERYLDLLKDSIRLRFRADVPVGFNISGGIDSSLLLALVNLYEKNSNINAYSFYTGDACYDELPWVEEMISQTQNRLTPVKFTADEVEETNSLITKIQEEPFGGIPTLAYSQIFSQAQKDGVKVLLDGQGMDEQWAGYDYYLNATSKSTIQATGNRSAFRPQTLQSDFRSWGEKPVYPKPFDSDLQNLQYRDLFYTKIPRALRFNDRISMAYSTELREPFLDYKLVEFAFAQPTEYKIHQGTQKYMLREILKPLVSKNLRLAPKRPLQTPQREWLGNELKNWVEKRMKILQKSEASEWFNSKEMQKEWQDYLAGKQESSFHIWQWVNASYLLP